MRFAIPGFIMPLLFAASVAASGTPTTSATVTRNVVAEGSCAVVGMSAEQCQLMALQRARAAAIEQAAGVTVSSSTLVTDFKLAADFIKTFSKGSVVRERVEWQPLGQYQKDRSSAPIPEYRVTIVADVAVSESKIKPIGLRAKSDSPVYRSGQSARLEVQTGREARLAIFNIMANDEVVLLFPNEHDRRNLAKPRDPLFFPDKDSVTEIVMQTLPGHERDAEAFFVVAVDSAFTGEITDLFTPAVPMKLTDFFRRYADIADYSEDAIVTYEVVGRGEQ